MTKSVKPGKIRVILKFASLEAGNASFMSNRIFVYGSLRRHEAMHAYLAGSRFLGFARTLPRFTMLNLGAYPAVVSGGHTAVTGEVYHVKQGLLAQLDRYEDYPREFRRILIPTRFGRAWIYLFRGRRADRRRVRSGDWQQGTAPYTRRPEPARCG